MFGRENSLRLPRRSVSGLTLVEIFNHVQMIKQLIEDLTFEKITLSQALTRAKIIAYKIKNDDFKDWLIGEISGGYEGRELPSYRVITCEIEAKVSVPFQGTRIVPMDVTELKDFAGKYSFNEMRMTQSIGTIELGQSQSGGSSYGFDYFPMELTNQFKKMTTGGSSIISIRRKVQLSELDYILEQTKQKLLDTLLELNEKFPDLENEFENTSANNQKVRSIITQHIYGNNSSSNIGIGKNITQHVIAENKVAELINGLEELGVESHQTEELKTIIQQTDKNGVGKKILGWLGRISTTAIEKGIDLKLPEILEKLQDYI